MLRRAGLVSCCSWLLRASARSHNKRGGSPLHSGGGVVMRVAVWAGRPLVIVLVCVCVLVLGAGGAVAALPSGFASEGPTAFPVPFASIGSGAGPLVKPASSPLPATCAGQGEGAGQLIEPSGIAVNQTTGDIYVLDRRNNRVDEFSGECAFVRAFGWDVNAKEPREELQVCTPVTGCQAGTSGESGLGGPGQLHEPHLLGGIAVDQTTEDVYVLDRGNARVEKYTPEGAFVLQFPAGGDSIAVGPTGTVYVGEGGVVQQYGPEGKAGVRLELEGAGRIGGLAVNAEGELYIAEEFAGVGETLPVRRYSAAGLLLGVFDEEAGGHALSLTLDAAGDVFVNHVLPSPEPQQIREFTPAGVQLAAFATAEGADREGLAFDAQTGALYVALGGGGEIAVLARPEPGPLVSQESASNIEPQAVIVHAVIGPDAPESCGETHYRVEYGTTPGYGKSAPLGEGALPRSFEEDHVEVPLGELAPRTLYHYRFVASDECEESVGVETKHTTAGTDATFTTLPPALIEAEFVTDVRSTSVTLHATVNPLGSATTYHFLYGPCGEGECAIPVPDGRARLRQGVGGNRTAPPGPHRRAGIPLPRDHDGPARRSRGRSTLLHHPDRRRSRAARSPPVGTRLPTGQARRLPHRHRRILLRAGRGGW